MPKLTKKGQITIPKEVRDKLRLKKGDLVEFIIVGNDCIIKKRNSINIDKWLGALGKSKTDDFIDEIRGKNLDNSC